MTDQVAEKSIAPMLVASVKMQGKYSDCGAGFKKIGRAFGRHICGKALMLIHDGEYREEDANFEVAMPIRRGESKDDVKVQTLPGGRCLSFLHHGPYDEINRSYETILSYAKENDLQHSAPSREIYIKGPGMIFKGNPKKYITEIQLMLIET